MKNMESKVHDAMYRQGLCRGYAAPADVLMDIGVLLEKVLYFFVIIHYIIIILYQILMEIRN
mgnify:CR=1 FL=1